MGSNWTDDLREKVKTLWANHSATQIASILNAEGHPFSRNAVVGMLHRGGLTVNDKTEMHRATTALGQKTRVRMVRVNSNSNVLRVTQRQEIEQYKLRCVEIVPRALTLIELEAGDCRYPSAEAPFTFCGHPVKQGSSYCIPHHFLCWERPRPLSEKYLIKRFAA